MASGIFDFKKEYKDLYMPKDKPMLIDVPEMSFIMVDGQKDPNNNPDYQEAIEILYLLSYTIKMSVKSGNQPNNYFEYVVPPLEGLWWISDGLFDFEKRDNWLWTSMMRQPDFVTKEVFEWAVVQAKKKKPELNFEKARLNMFTEGLCVQAMHSGSYATEPATLDKMHEFMKEKNLNDDIFSGVRKHHEIYLSDPRKTSSEKLKTVLRHPVKKSAH